MQAIAQQGWNDRIQLGQKIFKMLLVIFNLGALQSHFSHSY